MTIRQRRPQASWTSVKRLAHHLRSTPQAWSPTLSPDGSAVAYISDTGGIPSLWVADRAGHTTARQISSTPDPVLSVSWSPDGEWLAYSSAIGSGVRSEVIVTRVDGSAARLVAGNPAHAVLGPWGQHGHELLVTICPTTPGGDNECVIINVATGERELLLRQPTAVALSLSADDRFVLVRTGTRGAYDCRVFDRQRAVSHELLPVPKAGCTDDGLIRPDPSGTATWVAYMLTDTGSPRRSLVAVPFGAEGRLGQAGTLAQRNDADLESVVSDRSGQRLILVWNVDGRSEMEHYDPATERRSSLQVPGTVVSSTTLARDGSCAVISAEGPLQPRSLWCLDLEDPRSSHWSPLQELGQIPELVEPSMRCFESHDGLALMGWLYEGRTDGACARGTVLVLHGGPEAQERPGFHPEHQILAASGFNVFAPNIRGSSGFGRVFEHADDRYGRNDAIDDVASCADHLLASGLAEPGRIAVAGRSYGGYAALMALIRHRPLFRAGIDVCGMSDLLSFFAESEPWIAQAAVTKYGDPATDARLLRALSPLQHASAIEVPVLIVHGALDTNVPVAESQRLADVLSGLDRDVEFMEVGGEGHEFRNREAKLAVDRRTVSFLDRVFD
jgi:dipeptidyl aminopeptidase/acylaminoacyl peptidase